MPALENFLATGSIRQHTSAYVSIDCQHASAYVNIRQHTSVEMPALEHLLARFKVLSLLALLVQKYKY